MRAIVIDQPNSVAIQDVETPTPGPSDVRIRSVVAGVCRTDLDIATGALDPRWVRFPVVPGHEWSGVVDVVGGLVTGIEPGQRVVCEGNIGCMRCQRCRAGDTHLCQSYDAVGFTRGGGWGEFVVVPARIVHPLPDHVSFEAASLVEPGSCVLKALERARIEPAETVGVVGVGALGALAIRIARLHSPAAIIAFGIREEELDLARTLGADAVVNVADHDAEVETQRLVGDLLDVVVETAGAIPAVELSTRLAREGGRVVLLGIAGQGLELTLPAGPHPSARPLDLRKRRLHDGGMVSDGGVAARTTRRPRPDRHAPLPTRAIRGRVRADGRPPGSRRQNRPRARGLMRLTRLTTAVVEANYDWTIVRAESDEGLAGWGEAFCAPALPETIRELAPLIEGRDARHVEPLVRRLHLATAHVSGGGTVFHAISGIEAALWDLVARSLEVPLWQLFGGCFRDRVRIYADCHAGDALTSYGATLVARHLPWMGADEPPETDPEEHWAPADARRCVHAGGVRPQSALDGRPRLYRAQVRPRSTAASG